MKESMVAEFEDMGIRFKFPENWKLEREDNEDGWSVSLQSPDTAFLLLSVREDMPSTNNMVDTALAALKEDYPDLESDDCVDSLAGQPAVGHDVRFFSFDLTNTCWIRSFYGARGTVLILCQLNDLEIDKYEPILRAICASIELED
jgi:hypothetical protein